MIEPESIPLFTGDLAQLEQHTDALLDESDGIRQAGGEAHRQFQGLSAFYQAPEAEDLFASTAPARDAADRFGDKLATVAAALRTYAAEVAPIAKRLEELRGQAAVFVAGLKDGSGEIDGKWTEDADKVGEHQALLHDVNVAQAEFAAAEVACNNKITALVGGTQYVLNTGAKQFMPLGAHLYGYSSEVLDQARELPWGTPETQHHDWWDVDDFDYYLQHGVKSFVWDGLIIDNVVGTVDGVLSMTGLNGEERFKKTWSGLARVVVGAETYLMESGGKEPEGIWATDFAQGSKVYAKEFGKSLVAWDMWDENPARASATVVFNVLTLGVGPLKMASAGKAGTAAKVASTVAKVGDAIDPISAAAKVTGSALPRISTVTSALRGMDKVPAASSPISVLELSDHTGRSVLVVRDGRFVVVKNDVLVTDPPMQERSVNAGAEMRADERQLAAVGSRSQPNRSPSTAVATGHDTPAAEHARGVGQTYQPAVGSSASGGALPVTAGGTGGIAHGGGSNPTTGSPGGDGEFRGGDGDLSPEERKRRQDELVRKANDPEWRKIYYDARGHRLSKNTIVNGVNLPIIKELPDGRWVAAYDVPHGPSEVRLGAKPLGRDTVPPGNLAELDQAAANREVARNLTNAEKAYQTNPSPESFAVLEKARSAYGAQLGQVPNNSKIAEALGEKAAELHVVPHVFPGAKDMQLPETPTGADRFDHAFELADGRYLVVESKSPAADLDWRHGVADPEDPARPHQGDDGGAKGMRVKQGTRLYARSILGLMVQRGGQDARIANILREALRKGRLEYVLVKADNPQGSSYAGAIIDHFKI
ncbi:hypothetical protein ACIQUX_29535 [Streptomyces sp. NPDC101133]|uniref:hypothetical protein n=1 Tax=Streptomyces sp. NPDC101133 TaxID=3366111 RepID=UPI00382F3039